MSIEPPSPWVSRFAPLVRPGGSVLDVACGGGRHCRLFRARGHGVTGIDRDIAITRAEGAELIAADLEDGSPWPLPGRVFDAVVVTAGSTARAAVAGCGLPGPGAVCIGEPSAAACRHLGLAVLAVASTPDAGGLVDALLAALAQP